MGEAWGAFPTWVYESSDAEYLSRILFPDALATATRRIGIWMSLAKLAARDDGYISTKLTMMPRSWFAGFTRPVSADFGESFPAIDLLGAQIARLPEGFGVVLAFARPYVQTLPADGSPAAARLDACKMRVQQILQGRTRSAYLDLMTENEISLDESKCFDEIHYRPDAAASITSAIVDVMRETMLTSR